MRIWRRVTGVYSSAVIWSAIKFGSESSPKKWKRSHYPLSAMPYCYTKLQPTLEWVDFNFWVNFSFKPSPLFFPHFTYLTNLTFSLDCVFPRSPVLLQLLEHDSLHVSDSRRHLTFSPPNYNLNNSLISQTEWKHLQLITKNILSDYFSH